RRRSTTWLVARVRAHDAPARPVQLAEPGISAQDRRRCAAAALVRPARAAPPIEPVFIEQEETSQNAESFLRNAGDRTAAFHLQRSLIAYSPLCAPLLAS